MHVFMNDSHTDCFQDGNLPYTLYHFWHNRLCRNTLYLVLFVCLVNILRGCRDFSIVFIAEDRITKFYSKNANTFDCSKEPRETLVYLLKTAKPP